MFEGIGMAAAPTRGQRMVLRYGPWLVKRLWLWPSAQRAARRRLVATRLALKPVEAVTLFCGPVRFEGFGDTGEPAADRIRIVFPETPPQGSSDPRIGDRAPGTARGAGT